MSLKGRPLTIEWVPLHPCLLFFGGDVAGFKLVSFKLKYALDTERLFNLLFTENRYL